MMDALTLWLGERLLIGSLQGAVVIAAVWLTCRLVPRIPAAAQSALWWLVALKLVLTFAPLPALPVPLLPAAFEQQTERVLLPPLASDSVESAVTPRATPPLNQINTWLPAVIVLWFSVLLVQAARLFRAHRVLRGILLRAVAWPDELTTELAQRLGLKRVPQVRLSDEIDTPQVFGLRTPVVLVPTETMTAFTAEERAMTLCHELMHIRRRDLTLGWVPAFAERLFFFHPLARLAAREYVAARESACDAAAVGALGVSASDYGRMLIRLGIGHAGPALAAGGSPFSASSLKRRLNMLQRPGTAGLSRRWRWAIALAAAVVIPMQLVARTSAPQEPITWQQSPESVVFKADHAGHERTFLAHIHHVTRRIIGRVPSVDLHMFFKTFFAQESQKTLVVAQERAVERQKVDDLKRRVVEKKQKTKEVDVNKLEMMKLIEVKAQDKRAKADLRDDLKLKKLHFEKDDQKKRLQETTESEQLRQLAERYQELAVEARRLADEFERLQRQSVQQK